MRAIILFINLTLLFLPASVFASAAIEARQRAMQAQQQQAIRQHQQQIIQQQQQAYQQAVLQRQHQLQQQAVSQAVAARNAQQQAYNQAVQQKIQQVVQENQIAAMSAQQQIAYRIQAQQQAQQQAYQQAMAQTGVLMSNSYGQMPQMPMGSSQVTIPNIQAPAYGDLFYTPPVAEVVNITDIWKKMEENSRAWTLMIDMEPKVLTVQRMIDHFQEKGIRVQKGPTHYVQLIDSMAFQNPQMLDQPFESIMKVIAIIEYDFDNGQDKDALARQIFPDDKQFMDNKKRLGF